MRLVTHLALLTTLPLFSCSSDKDHGEDTGHVDTGDTEADTDTDTDTDVDIPDTYAFDSAFVTGESSVSYSGQIFRQVLMADMKAAIGGLNDLVDANPGQLATPGTTSSYLAGVYYTAEFLDGSTEHALSFSSEALQTTFDQVSSGKNLQGKTAGNDTKTDHKNWSEDFAGWNGAGGESPEALIYEWLSQLDDNVVTYVNGGDLTGIDGSPVDSVFLTSDGLDLQQLLQKFLGVAVGFSQGADDYMDDDIEGKGLLAGHAEAAGEGKTYSALEHAWDEGYGYFGGAQAYGSWTDDENQAASSGYDTNGDGFIDLLTEVNWGHSVNAAKRDLGAVAATDYTADAWEGFTLGRQLLADTAGSDLTTAEMNELKGYRDLAIGAWEKAIASTAVHYINDCLQDLNASSLDAANLAKHWSELKGFALGFQFNPRSPMSDADFVTFHNLIGDAPSLDAGYPADLVEARELLENAYSFDSANMGDANGENGW